MFTGAHFLLYSQDPDADRAFLRDILGFQSVDLGHNWLIFALPPAELAVHPATDNFVQKHADHAMMGAILYLMCDDLQATMKELVKRGVDCSAVVKAEWGSSTSLRLPSGGHIGLYQPTHLTAIGLAPMKILGKRKPPAKKKTKKRQA
jgi:hypothetical protein